jgi:hypothetical protein
MIEGTLNSGDMPLEELSCPWLIFSMFGNSCKHDVALLYFDFKQ